MQAWLEQHCEMPAFLDSDDLKDLTQLTQHVCESECLVLIQVRAADASRSGPSRRAPPSPPSRTHACPPLSECPPAQSKNVLTRP